MYKKIVNPKTGRKLLITSKIGKKVLQNYVHQLGGSFMVGDDIFSKLFSFEPGDFGEDYDSDDYDSEDLEENEFVVEIDNNQYPGHRSIIANPDLTLTMTRVVHETFIINESTFLEDENKIVQIEIYKPWKDSDLLKTKRYGENNNTGLVHICTINFIPTKILLMDDGFNLYGTILKTIYFNVQINENHPFNAFKTVFKSSLNNEINITKIIKKYLLYYVLNNQTYIILLQKMLLSILRVNKLENIDQSFNINSNSDQYSAFFLNHNSFQLGTGSKRFKIHLSININSWKFVFLKIIKFFNDNVKYLKSMKFFIIHNANHQYDKYNIDSEYTSQNKSWYKYIRGAATANFVIYPNKFPIVSGESGIEVDQEQLYFKEVINKLMKYCNEEGIDAVGRDINNLAYNERLSKALYIAYGSSSSQKSTIEQDINDFLLGDCIVVTRRWDHTSFKSGIIEKINADQTYNVLINGDDLLEDIHKNRIYTGANYIQRFKNDHSSWEISPTMEKERINICNNDDLDVTECLDDKYNITKAELCNDDISPADFWFTKSHSKPGDDEDLVSRCSF